MGKSRRKKRFSSVKRERKRLDSAAVVERPEVSQAREAITQPSVISSSVAPRPRYPYIATELRTIGILAGVMILILVVLRFVLT